MAALVRFSKWNLCDRAWKCISVNPLSVKWVFCFGFFQRNLHLLPLPVFMFVPGGWWGMTADWGFGRHLVNEAKIFMWFWLYLVIVLMIPFGNALLVTGKVSQG